MALSVRALLSAVALACAILVQAPAATAEPTGPGSCDPLNAGSSPDSCANQPAQTWPVAQGNYTAELDPGWVYFQPAGFDGKGCGIGPNGTVGCDIVPGRWPDGTPVQAGMPGPPGYYSCDGRRCPLPPPGTNETVASPSGPAEYVQSDEPVFTRDVDVLPAGYQLLNGGASCHVGYQGTVTCATGGNGFTLAAVFGLLEAPPA